MRELPSLTIATAGQPRCATPSHRAADSGAYSVCQPSRQMLSQASPQSDRLDSVADSEQFGSSADAATAASQRTQRRRHVL